MHRRCGCIPGLRRIRWSVDLHGWCPRASEITWLDAQLIGQDSDAVCSGERHILAHVEALALGKPLEDVGGLMAGLEPYRLDLVLVVLRLPALAAGRHLIPQRLPGPVHVMTDDGRDLPVHPRP